MRVKSVEFEDDNFRVWFEHGGVSWFKYFPADLDYMFMGALEEFLNSVIEDTIVRTR